MIENFVPKDADHIKGLPRGNRVDQDVAMNANEMLGIQDAVFVLEAACVMRCQVRWPTIVAAAGRFGMGVQGQICNHHPLQLLSERLPDPPCRLFLSKILARGV